MLKIEIVVGECTGAELAATSAYLATLARLKGDTEATTLQRALGYAAEPAPQQLTVQIKADASQAIAEIERATVAADGARAAGVNMGVVNVTVDTVKPATDPLQAALAKSGHAVNDAYLAGTTAKIDPFDLPDAGEDTMQSTPVRMPPIPCAAALASIPAPSSSPFAAFQAQAAAAAQVPPVPNVASSTAGAAPQLIAPAAPPVSSPAPTGELIQPAPPAPTAAAQPAAQPGSVPVDSRGLPWDARIHSGSRAVNADKSWRFKRNVDPALQVSVEAELRQVMGIAPAAEKPWPFTPPGGPITIVDSTPGTDTVTDLVPNVTAAPPSEPTPTTHTTPVAAPEILAGTSANPFGDLMDELLVLMNDGRANMAMFNEAAKSHGLPAFNMLAARPDLVPAVRASIMAMVG